MLRTAPSLQSQNEMKEFLGIISPSMRYRVLIFQYKRVLINMSLFKEKETQLDYVLQRIEISFHEPEQQIMR